MKWDPKKYTEFADHRGRPYLDLLGQLGDLNPVHVIDLGCGPGNMTKLLAERWPNAEVLGLDSSAEMISRARESVALPNLRFEQVDARHWHPNPATDLLFSNAMLQWVPEHRELLKQWLGELRPGASVAVQMPGNFQSPSHVVMRQVSDSEKWTQRLAGVLRHDDVVDEPEKYQQLLVDAGYQANVWESTYHQVLAGEQPILDWVRGTALLPIRAVLTADEYLDFERDYADAVARYYPAIETPDGGKLTNFPFRRIFITGRKLG